MNRPTEAKKPARIHPHFWLGVIAATAFNTIGDALWSWITQQG